LYWLVKAYTHPLIDVLSIVYVFRNTAVRQNVRRQPERCDYTFLI